MSSGEWISAGDAVEPQGGAQVDESSLTCSHFSGKQSPAFTFQMLPEARGAAPSLSPLPGTPAFLSPGTRVAGASEAVSLKGSTASKQEALVCHQRDSPSRHRLCPRDLLSAGERGAAGKNLLSPKHARVRRRRAAAATLTAVGSGHTFPFGQRTPCPPGQRGPTIHAEDPLSSGAEETLPSMQRRPATRGRGDPAIRGRGDPAIWGRGNPAIHAEGPHDPGQRGPSHPCRGDPAIRGSLICGWL